MTSTKRKQRVFTVQQANAMLPLVRSITSDLTSLARDLVERRSRLAVLSDTRELTAGDPYAEELMHIGRQLDEDTRLIGNYTHELQELGLEPRDATLGLIDYPAELEGSPIRLCWKLGESEVSHWHPAGDPCSDRRLLPATDASLSTALSSPSQQ